MASVTSFVDPGVKDKDFTKFFLQSPECHIHLLARFADTPNARLKDSLASILAERLWSQVVKPEEFMLAYAQQARTWLCIKTGTASHFPQLEPPAQLLREFGSDRWYGPLTNLKEGTRIYLRPFKVTHFALVGNRPVQTRVRWMVVAEVGSGWLSLSWNGFTSREDKEKTQGAQFPFWKYIPDAFQELESHLGGTWEHLALNKIVLKDLWQRYIDQPDYQWEHLRVRAEAAGVALNAKSARIVSELDVKGLEKLTGSIAKSALSALNIRTTREDMERVENATLKALIHEWGTLSYEFALSKRSRSGSNKTLFHGHCYFGQRGELETQDSLQHIKCYKTAGGNAGARKFLLSQLGIPHGAASN